MPVDHGDGLARLLAEVAQQRFELRRLAPVRQLARLRRQRVLRRVVEEHGCTGEVVALAHLLECVLEHLQLISIAVAQRARGGVQRDRLRPTQRALGRSRPEGVLEVRDLPAHHLVVAGHVDVRDVRGPLLVEDLLGEREVRLRCLIDEVAVDDEHVRFRCLDLLQRPPGTGDRVAVRIRRDELGVAHDRDVLRAILDGARGQQGWVVDGGVLGGCGLGRGDGLQACHRDVARVLLTRPGLHDADPFEGQRLGEPRRHLEADLLPALEVEVVAVQVRHDAVRAAHLQPRPGTGPVAVDHHLEGQCVAVHGHRIVRHEVVAAGRRRLREVVLHRQRRLPVLRGLTRGEGPGRPRRLIGESVEVAEVDDVRHLCADGDRDRGRRIARPERHRTPGGLLGRGDDVVAEAVDAHVDAVARHDLQVAGFDAGGAPVGVEALDGQFCGVADLCEVEGAGAGSQADRLAQHAQVLPRGVALCGVGHA